MKFLFSLLLPLSFLSAHLPFEEHLPPTAPPSSHTLGLVWAKGQKGWGPLKHSFLEHLRDLFHIDVFVETGTYLGETSQVAAQIFSQVHTIELDPKLFNRAIAKFANNSRVHVYLGDSSEVLPQILPRLSGRMLFWLDGHYSGGTTAKGKVDTPILAEIQAIRESGIQDAVILIDDIRCYPSADYPTLQEAFSQILAINPEYQFAVMGDIAIAFLKSDTVSVTPCSRAATLSKIADRSWDYVALAEQEKVFAQAVGEEKECLFILFKICGQEEIDLKFGGYYNLWYGLYASGQNRDGVLNQYLTRAIKAGMDPARCANRYKLPTKRLDLR